MIPERGGGTGVQSPGGSASFKKQIRGIMSHCHFDFSSLRKLFLGLRLKRHNDYKEEV